MTGFPALVFPSLADAAVRSAVVPVLATGVATAMRRSSAAARHLVWAAALAAAVLMPAVSAAVPAWRWAVLPTPATATIMPMPSPAPGVPADKQPAPVPPPPTVLLPLFRPTRPPSATRPPTVAPLVAWPAESRVARIRSQWPAILVAAWAAGAVAVAAAWGAGVIAARRLIASAPLIRSGRLFEAVGELCRELGIGRPIALRVGGRAAVPLMAGAIRPVVLLPTAATDWPAAQLRAALLHELAHVRRWDYATLCLGRLCCAMYWYDSLAWLAAARLRAERERACDDAVLRVWADPAGYAAVLVSVAAAVRGRSPGAALPMARRSGLQERVGLILNRATNRRPVGRRIAALALLGSTALLLGVAALRLLPRMATGQAAILSEAAATRPAGTLDLLVIDGATHAPMVGATVEAWDERLLTTDAEGRLAVPVPPTPGPMFAMMVRRERHVGKVLEWNNDGDVPARYTVELPPGQTVGGRVVDDAGRPVVGATAVVTVNAESDANGHHYPPERRDLMDVSVQTGADGRWAFDGVPLKFATVEVGVWGKNATSQTRRATDGLLRRCTARPRPCSTERRRSSCTAASQSPAWW